MILNVKGLHVFCLKCKRLCTNRTAKCGLNGIQAKNCRYKEHKHYQSRIWNPDTKKVDRVKTWTGMELQEAIKMHEIFKKEVPKIKIKEKVVRPVLLNHCMNAYLDHMEGIGIPVHKRRKMSKNHILAYKRYMKRFLDLVGNIKVNEISETHVGMYHQWILDQKYGPRSYNDHIVCMSSFIKFVNTKFRYDIDNFFSEVKLKREPVNPEILTDEEIDKLFSVITYENGWCKQGKKNVNRCYPWLKDAIMIGLLTGERQDGIFYLEWSHVDGNYLKIPNFKVNRIYGMDEFHYVPITYDLGMLLDRLKVRDTGYILEPNRTNRETLKSVCSKAFTHFWRLTGIEKDITFRNLRKTYITKIRTILGDRTSVLNIHKNDDIQIKHYIDKQEIQKSLIGVKLYNRC